MQRNRRTLTDTCRCRLCCGRGLWRNYNDTATVRPDPSQRDACEHRKRRSRARGDSQRISDALQPAHEYFSEKQSLLCVCMHDRASEQQKQMRLGLQ